MSGCHAACVYSCNVWRQLQHERERGGETFINCLACGCWGGVMSRAGCVRARGRAGAYVVVVAEVPGGGGVGGGGGNGS